jgi:Phage Mu protein F like protein
MVLLRETLTINQYHKKIAPLEANLEKEIAKRFRAQGLAFGRVIDTAFGLREAQINPQADQLFDSAVGFDIGTIAKEITRCYVSGSVAASVDYNLGISFTLDNPRAVAYGKKRATELLAELNKTTKKDIQRLVVQALADGTSPDALARQIKGLFIDYAKPSKGSGKQSRAKLVAVTETAIAYQAGNYNAVISASGTGLEFEKSWLPVAKPCPYCKANADQGWIAVSDPHSNGSLYPPAHPNCRCAELYQRKASTKPKKTPTKAPTTRKPRAKAPEAAQAAPTPMPVPTPPPTLTTLAPSTVKKFDFNNQEHYKALDAQLAAIFPNTSTFWNKKVILTRDLADALGEYNPRDGSFMLRADYANAVAQRHRDEAFRASIHELLHARSKGTRDYGIEGLGWEEAVIEANAQLHTERIAKQVGYSSNELTQHYNKHPYVAKWIVPLDNALKDAGIDRESFYNSMLEKTCEDRKNFVRDALVKKYGREEGRTRFLELNKALR